MTTVYVLNGPNLGRLGTREPEVYGRTTYADLVALCEQAGAEFDQENAELQAACGQAVAPGPADALDEAVSAEFADRSA